MEFRELIEGLEPGEPVLLGNLMVVPLKGVLNPVALEPLHLALEEGEARVKELGEVERILVENPSLKDLFVMEGEELLGARQDRVVVSSTVVPARENVELPVVCIERGRWEGEDPLFKGGYVVHPRLRSFITMSIKQRKRVDQEGVWREVERKLTSLRVSSVTGSLHHSFAQRERLLEELYGGWAPSGDVTGVMALTPRGFLCCDLLANPDLLAGEWPGLLKGYALDALEERMVSGTRGDWDDPQNLWSRLAEARVLEGTSTRGRGKEFFLEGTGVMGRALVVEGGLIHASFHPGE